MTQVIENHSTTSCSSTSSPATAGIANFEHSLDFTFQNIEKVIKNAVFKTESEDPSTGVYSYAKIVEELAYICLLVKQGFNARNPKTRMRPEDRQKTLSFFNPDPQQEKGKPKRKLWKPKVAIEAYPFGLIYKCDKISTDYEKFQGYVQYQGIFNLGVDNPNVHLVVIDESWNNVWRLFYKHVKITKEDITMENVNAMITVYTELTRNIIWKSRAGDRCAARLIAQGTQVAEAGIPTQVDENVYWKDIDEIRNGIIGERSLDLNNEMVFKCVTDLVNGGLRFYEAALNYPQVNLLEPDSIPTRNSTVSLQWCFTHIEPKFYSLIAGTLKNITRNENATFVKLLGSVKSTKEKEQQNTRRVSIFASLFSSVKSSQSDLMRSYLQTILEGSIDKEEKNKRMQTLKFMAAAMMKLDKEQIEIELPKDIEEACEDMDMSVLVKLQTNAMSTLATGIIKSIEEAAKVYNIWSNEDGQAADKLLDIAMDIIEKYGMEGRDCKVERVKAMLSFLNLNGIDYAETYFIGKKQTFWYVGRYVPTRFNAHWCEVNEEYRKAYENRPAGRLILNDPRDKALLDEEKKQKDAEKKKQAKKAKEVKEIPAETPKRSDDRPAQKRFGSQRRDTGNANQGRTGTANQGRNGTAQRGGRTGTANQGNRTANQGNRTGNAQRGRNGNASSTVANEIMA